MQKFALFGEDQNVPFLRALRKREDTLFFIVIFVAMLGLTPLLIYFGLQRSVGLTLGAVAALIAIFVVVRWRSVGFFLIVGCTTLIEQESISTNIFTDRLNVYAWPNSLAGIPERPIGLLFLLILFACIGARFVKRERALSGGVLIWPLLGFLGCVLFEVLYGVSTSGDLKSMILEIRPFWYLFINYLLAYNFITQKNHVRAFFWIVIISAGVKGLQGCYIYIFALHLHLAGQNEIMAHEESFFFAALLLLILIFYMHDRYRPQLYTALVAMPFVLVAMAANNRRADYIALLVGALVSWTLIFVVKKQARKALLIGMIIFLLLGGSYVAAFGGTDHSWAAPARAVVSVIAPSAQDSRDANSNLYRTIEDFDLKYTAKQSFPLGYGFGKEFLQPKILPNILSEDPVYLIIPHNTIYWVWMRLGAIGFLVFWYLIGAMIIRGCLIVRQLQDAYLRTVAIYIVALIVMEIIVAYADYQLYALRNVIYLGLLAGMLLRLPALDKEETPGGSLALVGRGKQAIKMGKEVRSQKLLAVKKTTRNRKVVMARKVAQTRRSSPPHVTAILQAEEHIEATEKWGMQYTKQESMTTTKQWDAQNSEEQSVPGTKQEGARDSERQSVPTMEKESGQYTKQEPLQDKESTQKLTIVRPPESPSSPLKPDA